jgi:hypothetical protein
VNTKNGIDPEHEAILADSVGLALLVVLDTLAPAERLAFVLHDMFAVPFDEIAPIVGRSPIVAKKLASRARHRVRGTTTIPSADLTRHRQLVDAFLAPSRGGDINSLLAVLDTDVVRRADRGARAFAEETLNHSQRARFAQPALVNGALGIVVGARGQLDLALSLTIRGEKISEIDVIADPARLHQLDLAVLER